MQNEQAPAAPAQQGGGQPEGSNPISQALNGANDMLTQLATAVEASEGAFAPEAKEHLQNAVMEYQNFMKVAMGGESDDLEESGKGMMPADTAGRKGAVPADMPMGKGIKPVPA